jgi:hypothetical protein
MADNDTPMTPEVAAQAAAKVEVVRQQGGAFKYRVFFARRGYHLHVEEVIAKDAATALKMASVQFSARANGEIDRDL